MIFEIQTKDTEGNVVFSGKMNAKEATFVLNVGINYLLANGAIPLFTGKEDDELDIVSPANETMQ